MDQLPHTDTIDPEVSPKYRCDRCKGPVHARQSFPGWWCALCGIVEAFILEDRNLRDCSAKDCLFGWDETRSKTCRSCGGTGTELIRPPEPEEQEHV